MTRYIPNLITSLNLTAGFFAIIYGAGGDTVTASWLIIAAMIFDFLDGFSARLLKAYSVVGKELDSLADVVSFGVAPAMIIYSLAHHQLNPGSEVIAGEAGSKQIILLIITAAMPVCAALRLAVFNTDTTQSTTFKGLPTPANALAVISLVLAGYFSHSAAVSSIITSPLILSILTLVLSLLMVSRIPLLSLKFSNLKLQGNEGRFMLILIILILFAIFGMKAMPLIIPLYIAVSLISLIF